jgi:hypothetical protein
MIGTDVLLTAVANQLGGPHVAGAPANQGKQLLGKLLAEHPAIVLDSLAEHIVDVTINPSFANFIEIQTSDPDFSIWQNVEIFDTNGFVCTQWDIDNNQNPPETLGCLAWMQTSLPPWDSVEVVVDTMPVLDSTKLCLNNATVRLFVCGDINGDGNVANVLDLNLLINRIFRLGRAGNPPQAADLNCDGGNGNILDLNLLINRIFRNGPPVCNSPGCN